MTDGEETPSGSIPDPKGPARQGPQHGDGAGAPTPRDLGRWKRAALRRRVAALEADAGGARVRAQSAVEADLEDRTSQILSAWLEHERERLERTSGPTFVEVAGRFLRYLWRCEVRAEDLDPERLRALFLLLGRCEQIDQWRAQQRQPDVQPLHDAAQLAADPASDPSVAAQLREEREQQEAQVEELLATLPPGQREVTRLRAAGHPVAEIAAQLHCSASAVSSQLYRVRKKLEAHAATAVAAAGSSGRP